jgi:hypothetical protein
MRKIKALGLCLVAACALSAFAASGASAATYNVCQKVAKKTGKYANATCTTLDEKKGKPAGDYEIAPVKECSEVAKKTGKYGTDTCTTLKEKKGKPNGDFEITKIPLEANSGVATLETPAFGSNNVSCQSSHIIGDITGPKTATEQVTFSECKLAGVVACTSLGSAAAGGTEPSGPNTAEEIKTNVLHINLLSFPETTKGFEGKQVPAGKVWTETTAASGVSGYQAVFSCPGASAFLRTNGSLSGETSPIWSGTPSAAHLSATSKVKFSRAEQEAHPLFEGEAGLLSEAAGSYSFSPVNGPAQSFQNEEVTVNTAPQLIEINL